MMNKEDKGIVEMDIAKICIAGLLLMKGADMAIDEQNEAIRCLRGYARAMAKACGLDIESTEWRIDKAVDVLFSDIGGRTC